MSDAHTPATPPLYGVMAEFKTADELIAATKAAVDAGYTRLDGYSPYPLGEVADHLGFPRSEIGAVMFIGGVCGAVLGFTMQTWITVIDYPLNIGGKPFWSWPQFIPITWALLVLTACMSGVFGLLALCGLPQPYHPVFNVDRFRRASKDRFFLCIEAVDPKFDPAAVKAFLTTLKPDDVAEVPE
ncbi:MAG: DUF3341 domain-containing protein [Fimbriiglobus sp.]|nr:DUF3341 domain-containing protein [Fimbriiglobus sp.]